MDGRGGGGALAEDNDRPYFQRALGGVKEGEIGGGLVAFAQKKSLIKEGISLNEASLSLKTTFSMRALIGWVM